MSEEENKCGCGDGCGSEEKSGSCGSDCGCEEGKCSCESGSCCEDSSCGSESQMPKMMLGIANQAYAELLRDKMKKHYEAAIGKKLDAAAKVAVDANIALWDGKMQQKEQFQDFEKKLSDALNS